jgi:hypothetical protein
MSDEPMREPSVPSAKVRGPLDLVARMNESTSEDYDLVPYPARQQLGDHSEPYDKGPSEAPGLADFVGKRGAELSHSVELSEPGLSLAQPVTYHLEATEPNAQVDGGPGSSGYNVLQRGVQPAEGEFPGDVYSLEQGAGVRTFRLAEGVGDDSRLGDPNEVVVGSVNPKNIKEDTRERSSQTASVNDPYRNADGSLKDPEDVHDESPALPNDFGSKVPLEGAEAPEQAAKAEGALNEGGNDPAEGKDQTTPPVGGGDEDQDPGKGARRGGRGRARHAAEGDSDK